jgi:hypothetical protein
MKFISIVATLLLFAHVLYAQTERKEFIVYFETSPHCNASVKPLLQDLEASALASEAWIDREGKFIGITLAEPYLPMRQLLQKTKVIFDKYEVTFRPVQSPKTQADLRINYRAEGMWYRASDAGLANAAAVGTYKSTITCPKCGFKKTETLPDDRCIMEYTCQHCKTVIKHKKGDCCVFCSYGDVKCPTTE